MIFHKKAPTENGRDLEQNNMDKKVNLTSKVENFQGLTPALKDILLDLLWRGSIAGETLKSYFPANLRRENIISDRVETLPVTKTKTIIDQVSFYKS